MCADPHRAPLFIFLPVFSSADEKISMPHPARPGLPDQGRNSSGEEAERKTAVIFLNGGGTVRGPGVPKRKPGERR